MYRNSCAVTRSALQFHRHATCSQPVLVPTPAAAAVGAGAVHRVQRAGAHTAGVYAVLS